jgi:hypothetical protein
MEFWLVKTKEEKEEELCVFLWSFVFGEMSFYIDGDDMIFFFSTFASRTFKETFQDQNCYYLKFKQTSFERPPLIREIF